ncbi:MAG: T9SS type A sorting domain-containing protein [Bacteroidia bacterium]
MRKLLTIYFLLIFLGNQAANKYYVSGTFTLGISVYVSASGVDAAGKGQAKNTPAATLTWILNSSGYSFASGDTIFVDAGNYTGQGLSSPPNGIVIYGAGSTSTYFTSGYSCGSDHYFMNINDNNTVLYGMTLSCFGSNTGPAQVLAVAANTTGVQINDVVINNTQQTSSLSGYPIEIASGANVTINGGGSTCNSWDAGGGIHSTSATVTINFHLFFSNSNIFQNGSALRIDGGTVIVKNSNFKKNAIYPDLGGAAIYISSGTVNVYDCMIDSNVTNLNNDSYAGDVLIAGGTVRITRSVISHHRINVSSGSSKPYGGGVSVTGGALTIDSTYFYGNTGKNGNDVFNKGGTILARNCIFGSASTQIGVNSGVANSFSITTCGSPGITTTSGSVKQIDNNSPTYTANPTTPGYSGSCASSVLILPIELVAFESFCSQNKTNLYWQTASEQNNQDFLVERSNDGFVFKVIGKVSGSGTSTTMRSYYYADESENNSTTFYRLTQRDYNGSTSRSKVITAKNTCTNDQVAEINVFPNPSANDFNLELKLYSNTEVIIEVYDELGRLSMPEINQTMEEGIRAMQIEGESLEKGIYTLRLLLDNKVYLKKLIKL